MKLMNAFVLLVAFFVSADAFAASTRSSSPSFSSSHSSSHSFGGTSKSTVTSGGGSKSSFGGISKSTPTVSNITTRSSLPTRSTPAVTYNTPSSSSSTRTSSPFGGASPSTSKPSPFGGATQSPQVATNQRSTFGGVTSSQDRSSLPTRSWQPKPQVATQSNADIALSNRAKSSGTFYNNRQDAMSSFKQKYNTTYTSHYTVQPSAWPTHIPRTYRYNNSSYNITFNPTYGGYGYWYGSTWRNYDVFDDLIMLDVLMNNHNYYVPPVIYTTPTNYQTQTYDADSGQTTTTTYTTPIAQQPVIVSSGGPGFGTVMIVLGVVFGVVIVIAVAANMSKGY